MSVEAALGSVPAQGLTFPALALDDAGRAVPVVHSDLGFALLFADPPGAELERMVTAAARPYPAGLMTPAGMVVANAAFAPPELLARFSRAAYHGAVVWSWQQALMLAGLDRQLRRRDLQPQVRAELVRFRDLLHGLLNANRKLANSELWSWADKQGKIVPTAFGSASADADESNAAQLWSAASLASGL